MVVARVRQQPEVLFLVALPTHSRNKQQSATHAPIAKLLQNISPCFSAPSPPPPPYLALPSFLHFYELRLPPVRDVASEKDPPWVQRGAFGDDDDDEVDNYSVTPSTLGRSQRSPATDSSRPSFAVICL